MPLTQKRKRFKPETCDVCGCPTKVVDSKAVYGVKHAGWDSYIQCTDIFCRAFAPTRSHTYYASKPMFSESVRKARIEAHKVFDMLWSDHPEWRDQAYRWLAGEMGLRRATCHIRMFNYHQCQQVVELVNENYVRLRREWHIAENKKKPVNS